MAVESKYRARRRAFARRAADVRLGSRWTVGGRVVLAIVGAAISSGSAAVIGAQPVDWSLLLFAIIGAVGANLLWVTGVFVWSYLAAPAEMEQEAARPNAEELARLQELLDAQKRAQEPAEAMRLINRHLALQSGIYKRARAVDRSSDVEDWTPVLRDVVDWMDEARKMIETNCLSKGHDADRLWRSIPSAIREAGRNEDGSPWVDGRAADIRGWFDYASRLLRQRVEVIEARVR